MFAQFARLTEQYVGKPITFAFAVLVVVVWAITGPLFNWSDTWQLVINTGTTVVTFLMVFLIQSTQSRDTKALHLKLDELVRATPPARNEVIESEELAAEALETLRRESKGDKDE